MEQYICNVCYSRSDYYVKFDCQCKFNICNDCFNNIKSVEIEKLTKTKTLIEYNFLKCQICKVISKSLFYEFITSFILYEYASIATAFNKNREKYGIKRKSKIFNKIYDEKNNDYVLSSKTFEELLNNVKFDFNDYLLYFDNGNCIKMKSENGLKLFKQYINYKQSK